LYFIRQSLYLLVAYSGATRNNQTGLAINYETLFLNGQTRQGYASLTQVEATNDDLIE